jgi:hypothetical protein
MANKYRCQKKGSVLKNYSRRAPRNINQYEWGKITENRAREIINLLFERSLIKEFRHASKKEDEKLRTDFLVILNSGKMVGIQVKSSPEGVIDFFLKEIYNPIIRSYPVIAFIPNIKKQKNSEEADRLWKKIKQFENLSYIKH